MGKALPPNEMRLYRLCDEALYYIWDPIGVMGPPSARDEYYSYLPHVFELVKADRRSELLTYLREVSSSRMGLTRPDALLEERTVDFLFDARIWFESVGAASSDDE